MVNSGLVLSIPRRGTFVRDLSEEELREIFDIRVLLEIRIFEDLMRKKKLSIKDFQRLEAIVHDMVMKL